VGWLGWLFELRLLLSPPSIVWRVQ
jgi:hypothetical protein